MNACFCNRSPTNEPVIACFCNLSPTNMFRGCWAGRIDGPSWTIRSSATTLKTYCERFGHRWGSADGTQVGFR
eukprot:50291-Chlamydomonas_euryale.AAC.3